MECCVSHSWSFPGQLGLGHIHKDQMAEKRTDRAHYSGFYYIQLLYGLLFLNFNL